MCSIQCWVLSIWEALGWIFAFLAWFMHCQQGGEVWAWNGLLHAFRRFPSGFELFLSSCSFPSGICLTNGGHRSDRCSSQVLGDLTHRSDRWGWPVRAELMQLLCFLQVVFMHSSRGSCIGSEDHVWFEDRWMVASLCDEWLTTLCGLILG
jgi:hypothetical protein